MKSRIHFTILVCLAGLSMQAQTGYRNFPVVVSVQFHSLTLPFRDLGSNFSNVGIGLGTEVSYNGKPNWVQQFNIVWYRNRAVGDGLFLYTQPTWRPNLATNLYGEIKAGAGYLLAKRPVASFQPSDGNWAPVGRRGKGLFTIPVGISLGYDKFSPGTYVSPFVSYQFLLVSGYNTSVPVVPETLLQVGSRIHLK